MMNSRTPTDAEAARGKSWGHAGRYYSDAKTSAYPEVLWTGALKRSSKGIRETVERTCKQWNNIIRDYLRNETALRLSVGGDIQSVPVRVVDGVPWPFARVLEQFNGLEWLLLNRPTLAAAVLGTQFMENNLESGLQWLLENHDDLAAKALRDERCTEGPVTSRLPDMSRFASRKQIEQVKDTAEVWLKILDELDTVKRIVGINEDVLGAYFFTVPEIQIYWTVIGIISKLIDVSPEALTVVVLAHELAHAYTHLGRDIDGEEWATPNFAMSDPEIVEGLAQFYTQTVCERLEHRLPVAQLAYEKLLEKQSGCYKTHLDWRRDGESAGEIVRISMIECRSTGITSWEMFTEAIERHRVGVRGRPKRRDHHDEWMTSR